MNNLILVWSRSYWIPKYLFSKCIVCVASHHLSINWQLYHLQDTCVKKSNFHHKLWPLWSVHRCAVLQGMYTDAQCCQVSTQVCSVARSVHRCAVLPGQYTVVECCQVSTQVCGVAGSVHRCAMLPGQYTGVRCCQVSTQVLQCCQVSTQVCSVARSAHRCAVLPGQYTGVQCCQVSIQAVCHIWIESMSIKPSRSVYALH